MPKRLTYLILPALFCTSCIGSLFKDRSVEYRVSVNKGDFIVTYEGENGETKEERIGDYQIMWETHFEAERDQFLYISVEGLADNQTIDVMIFNKEDQLDRARATGDRTSAVASAYME